MNEKVSIIIPIYNCEMYIERCVNSLLRQTYSNIEIVLVNDGSTDNSLDICKKMCELDSRVKLFCKNNGGVSAARNYGIRMSTGTLIGFVDSDDWVDNHFIDCLYKGFQNKCDLSVVSYIKKYNDDVSAQEKQANNDKYIRLSLSDAYRFIFDKIDFFGFCWNKLYKKNIIEKLGSEPFSETLYACEDTLFNAKYLQFCNSIYYNESKLYYYFQRGDSATNSIVFNEKKISVLNALDEIEEIYLNSSRENLVYLYIFYLYNYYLLKNLIYHTKSNFKLNNVKIKKIFKYVIKSNKVSFLKKTKIAIKYYFPVVNEKLDNLIKKGGCK